LGKFRETLSPKVNNNKKGWGGAAEVAQLLSSIYEVLSSSLSIAIPALLYIKKFQSWSL
jgi:hypothetical protein